MKVINQSSLFGTTNLHNCRQRSLPVSRHASYSRQRDLRAEPHIRNKHSRAPWTLHIQFSSRTGYCCRAMASQQVFEAADAFSIIKSATDLAVGVGVLAALTYSVLPLIATNRDKNRENLAAKEEEAEEVKWGVMTLLSCLPLFNWLAWVFAALENKEQASFYYALAALYLLPQLEAGFDQNWFSIATLLAGIAHVQVERIAEEQGVSKEIQLKGGAPSSATKMLSDSARAFAEAIQGTKQESDSQKAAAPTEAEEDYATEELRKWDERFQSKDYEKEKN